MSCPNKSKAVFSGPLKSKSDRGNGETIKSSQVQYSYGLFVVVALPLKKTSNSNFLRPIAVTVVETLSDAISTP